MVLVFVTLRAYPCFRIKLSSLFLTTVLTILGQLNCISIKLSVGMDFGKFGDDWMYWN